jgi:hypothetical protein
LAPKNVNKRLINIDYFIAEKLSELAPKKVNKRLINIDYFIAEKLSELAPKNVNKRLTDRGGRAPGGGCSWELQRVLVGFFAYGLNGQPNLLH